MESRSRQEQQRKQNAGRGGRRNQKAKRPVVDHRKISNVSIDCPNAVVSDKPKTAHDIQLISSVLQKSFVFNSLKKQHMKVIIQHMRHYKLKQHQIVFEQEQPAINFFVVISGVLEVLVDFQRINLIQQGESFGELALIHDVPRSASVKSVEEVQMWGLDRRTFRHAVQYVNSLTYSQNRSFIDSVPLFSLLKDSEKEALVNTVSTLSFEPGQKIVREGDSGDIFYMVKEGIVVCTQEGKQLRHMTKGDFFGEQALLFNTPRTATITAMDNVKCLTISRDKLARIFGRNLLKIIYKNSQRMAIEKSPVLSVLSKQQTDLVISALTVVSYKAGDVVIRFGTPIQNKILIVLYGKVSEGPEKEFNTLDVIGEKSLTEVENLEMYHYDLTAIQDCDVAEITKDKLQEALGGNFMIVTSRNQALQALKRIQLFKGLPPLKCLSLLGALRQQEYKQGQVIFQQDTSGDCFFIINEGVVDIRKDNVSVRNITKLDYFGERSLLYSEPRTASVIAVSHVKCWTLHQFDFHNIIEQEIRTQLVKRIELQDTSIELEQLLFIKLLGRGMFGDVFLVANRNTGSLYALKTVIREKINAFQIHQSLILQRRILLLLDHHLILKLIKTFKDESRVYFLMEYVMGLDLFDTLRVLGIVNNEDALFYTACLIDIIEHLHERNIIYRDLKPENVMVDHQGYLKLIDFGTAKIINGRTYTVIGTPHYMSPQSISGRGYGLASDYWSIGVMLYEFICGCLPFGDDQQDPYMVYESILKRRLLYPRHFDKNSPARSLIEQLLSKNPGMRTGGSVDNLKAHQWFREFNWESINSRQARSPYTPEQTDYTEEIMRAERQVSDVREYIMAEEAGYTIPKNLRHKAKPITENWDSEF